MAMICEGVSASLDETSLGHSVGLSRLLKTGVDNEEESF